MSEHGKYIKLNWDDILQMVTHRYCCELNNIQYEGFSPPSDTNEVFMRIEVPKTEELR
jgi:hypothetical protein